MSIVALFVLVFAWLVFGPLIAALAKIAVFTGIGVLVAIAAYKEIRRMIKGEKL